MQFPKKSGRHTYCSGSLGKLCFEGRRETDSIWHFLARRVRTFCVEPSSTEFLTSIKDCHSICWQATVEEEHGIKTAGIIAFPGLAHSTQLWQAQLPQKTSHCFLYFSLCYISLTLTVLFPPKLKDQLLKSLIEIAKLPSHLFLSFLFFLNSAFLWLFELKKIWKERWTISRMPQTEAHYLWLLNDKSWNGFESRQDKRLVLNMTFDFNGLEQKPSFYAVQIAL